jgi:hypothetical protein
MTIDPQAHNSSIPGEEQNSRSLTKNDRIFHCRVVAGVFFENCGTCCIISSSLRVQVPVYRHPKDQVWADYGFTTSSKYPGTCPFKADKSWGWKCLRSFIVLSRFELWRNTNIALCMYTKRMKTCDDFKKPGRLRHVVEFRGYGSLGRWKTKVLGCLDSQHAQDCNIYKDSWVWPGTAERGFSIGAACHWFSRVLPQSKCINQLLNEPSSSSQCFTLIMGVSGWWFVRLLLATWDLRALKNWMQEK